MTCMSASTKAAKFGLRVSFQSLWSSLGYSFQQSLLKKDARATPEINQKSDSVSAPLKLMSSRMSPRASGQFRILVHVIYVRR